MPTVRILVLSLSLFLSVYVSAQQNEKDSTNLPFGYVVEDCLFSGSYPAFLSGKIESWYFSKGILDGHIVVLGTLRAGASLTDEEKAKGIFLNDISGSEEIIAREKIARDVHNGIMGEITVEVGDQVVAIGDEIFDFEAVDIQGKMWNKEALRGKPAVLNFWFVGCAPCIKEMPELNRWVQEYPGVNFLAVTWNTAEQIEPVVAKTPFLFTHLADNRALIRMFAIREYPATILVDPQGVVRGVANGTREEDKELLLTRLRELLVN